MAVKTAPEPGTMLIEEKRTRVEPAANGEDRQHGNRKHPPMWEFIDSLTPQDWNSKEYEMTIYRGTRENRGPWCGKFYEPMTPDKIQAKFGGGSYVIYFKVPPGSQLRYFENFEIVGAPKNDIDVTPAPVANDATSQLIAMFREEMRALREEMRVARGGDLAQEAMKGAMSLNAKVFETGVQSVQGVLSATQPHHANPMDDMTRVFMQAAIQKMLNPADPIEQFAKMMAAMKGLGLSDSGRGGSLAVEVVRGLTAQLPQMAAHVGGIMDSYRRAEEAKLQREAVVRGARVIEHAPTTAAPAGVAVMPSPAGAIPAVIPAISQGANSTLTPEQQAEQTFQYIETKIVELILDESMTPSEAADSALNFLDVTDKNIADELLRHGEPGLHWAFQNRPTLRRVPAGPRLDAFIAEFVNLGRKVAMPLAPDPNLPPA